MLKFIFSSLIFMLAVACAGPRYVDYFPYHDDGTPKPNIVLLPILDSSNSGLPWNVSLELSEALYYQLMHSGELYVMSPQECGTGWVNRQETDFFGNDLSFAKNFGEADFIVAMELIEHTKMSSEAYEDSTAPECHPYNSTLSVRLRVRVIDTRFEQPRIALYEVVKGAYKMSPPQDLFDYKKCAWGNREYSNTPCAVVHERLISNLAARLEQVVCTTR